MPRHAAGLLALLATACSAAPAPPAPPPPVAVTAAPTAEAAPLGPPELVPVDAPFNILPDEHRWSPNGDVLAIDDTMHRVLLWDAAAGAPRGVLGPFAERPMSLVWSDDAELLAAREGNRVHVFALRDGAKLRTFTLDDINSETFSPDGARIHLGTTGGLLITHEIAAGREVARVQLDVPKDHTVWGVARGAGGAAVAGVVIDRRHVVRGIGIWSTQDGKRLGLHDGHASFTWSEDGKALLLHANEATHAGARVRPGEPVETLSPPVALPRRAAKFVVDPMPDGHPGTMIRTAAGAPVRGPLPREEAAAIYSVEPATVRWTADGTHLVVHRAVYTDRWDLRTGRLVGSQQVDPRVIGAHARYLVMEAMERKSGNVYILDVATSDTRLTISSRRRPGRIADAGARRAAIIGVPEGQQTAKQPQAIGAVRDPLAELVTLVDIEAGAVERVVGVGGSPVSEVSFCGGGHLLVTRHEAGKDQREPLRLWDAATGKRRLDLPEGKLAACSEDGSTVAVSPPLATRKPVGASAKKPPPARKVAPERQRLDFFDAARQKRLSSVELDTTSPRFSLSPDGSLAVVASAAEIVLWDVRAGKKRASLAHRSKGGLQVAWHPSMKRILLAPGGEEAMVWDAASGAVLPLAGDARLPCHHLRWSPDGKRALVLRNGNRDPGGHATVEIFGERGERLDPPGRAFAVDNLGPALVVVDEPDGTRTLFDGAGAVRLGAEVKGSVLASWHANEIGDPFREPAMSPDGKFMAVAPLGIPAIVRLSDGASITLRSFTLEDGRAGVATTADGRFAGNDEAIALLTFRRGHWMRGPLLRGTDVAAERRAPNLLADFLAGR